MAKERDRVKGKFQGDFGCRNKEKSSWQRSGSERTWRVGSTSRSRGVGGCIQAGRTLRAVKKAGNSWCDQGITG